MYISYHCIKIAIIKMLISFCVLSTVLSRAFFIVSHQVAQFKPATGDITVC